MRSWKSLLFLLVLLCVPHGMAGTDGHHCTQREGTSLTVLMDAYMMYLGHSYYLEKALNSLSGRFPCVTRQYTSITLDYGETNETITNDKSIFLQNITRNYWDDTANTYYNHLSNCNQSLLYGVKRALQISPAESIIWVYTVGSMTDYNDTQLLSDVHTLLEEKKSQVYFLWYPWWNCMQNSSQRDVFINISSLSYGEVIPLYYTDYYKLYHSLALLLSKPLNSSVPLLNINKYVTDTNADKYNDTFNVPTSLSYLLITGDETFSINYTDPNGNTFKFEKNPYYYYYNYYYYYYYDLAILSSHLVKSPAAGSWILNAQGNTSLSVQILGFTELDKSESSYSCSGVDCAPDEECRIVGGVPGCYCKSGIQIGNLADDLTPQVTCGLGNIEVRFSKCLVEKWRYNTSSIHLRDYSCQGIIERRDKSYITLITWPAGGSCGGSSWNNGSVIRYTNTVYLATYSDGVIVRDGIPIDFYCDYPSDMEINLLTAISSYLVSATITVAGKANFTIKMGLFQDSGYTTPYTASEVWLSSSSILYVGVIVTGATASSPFVLVMKNCYATPTANSTYGPRYDILTNQCPNKNDPTLSVLENGVSLRGRFSLQVFKFLSGFSQIYLHCQVGLCDTSNSYCAAGCPAMRSASIDNINVTNITIGPIYQKADVSSVGATVSSVGGTAVPTAKLFFSAIVFLLLLY